MLQCCTIIPYIRDFSLSYTSIESQSIHDQYFMSCKLAVVLDVYAGSGHQVTNTGQHLEALRTGE